MYEQLGQPRVGGPHARLDPGPVQVKPQRQRVDEQPHRAVRAAATMHAPEQHRAEHHLLAVAAARHHLAPGQMAQARQAHPQPPRLHPQPVVKRLRQLPPRLVHPAAVAAHLAQPERQRRPVNLREHLPEELLMRRLSHTQPRLRYQVAEWLRLGQLMLASLQHGPDLGMHQLQRGVIPDQMMLQLQQQPARAAGLARNHKPQQGRPAKLDAVLARIKPMLQLRVARTTRPVQLDLAHLQQRVPPHHLGRARQPFPDKRRPQDIVPIHHPLNRGKIALEQVTVRKRHLRDQQVRIALCRQQMMEQDAVLQWRQVINVLDVADAAGHCGDDPVDLALLQLNQRQHLWRDRRTLFADQVGRDRHLVMATEACSQVRQHRLDEQGAHLDAQ
ncbi:hypothetical protein LMG24235_08699 [Paraburkholderia sabiae]|nr:hypothetical protein LMG24235_08699 [Paraburkholderia sabiae]